MAKSAQSAKTTYQRARLQVVGYRALQTAVSELLNQHDINTSQWVILGWLYDNPSGMRMTALAELLEVEVPLITALMQPLENAQLVVVQVDPTDRRAKIATLSDDGVRLVKTLEPAMMKHLAKFDRSLKKGDMDIYFNALETFIRASKIDS